MSKTAVGSVWRLWDFHAHTPASYHWEGQKLRGKTGAERDEVIKATVEAMRQAEPEVYVIMDYWTFDGYRAIRDYLVQNPDALAGKKVFPGIELRVESSLNKERLNVHLVLDPYVEDQIFADVLAELKIDLRAGDRGLSEQCFIQYARELGADKLKKHGFDLAKVKADDEYALDVGWHTAEIKPDSLKRVLDNTLIGKGLMLLPWDTYGGLKGIDFAQHYSEVRRMMRAADIFECKDAGCRAAFHGQRCTENAGYFDNFWAAIDKTKRLCVRGTDAHSFARYGKFPSDMKTWIKAEATYNGLLQAIREPFFRSYVGDIPPKKALVDANGRLFMRRLQVKKRAGAAVHEKWFDGINLELNTDLVAIIGNKGSGKSGLAEVLALAGNSKSKTFFTFLNERRFLSGGGPRASAFEAELHWRNGDVLKASLAQEPLPAEPERVKYISQTYFEDLCNEHVAGNSDRFGTEIRKVLFANMDPAERLSFLTLDAYLEAKEQSANDRIAAIRAQLDSVNQQLVDNERLASTTYTNDLKDKLASKELALKDLNAKRPQVIPAPASVSPNQVQTPEQARLVSIGAELEQQTQAIANAEAEKRRLTERRNALVRVVERLQLFAEQAATLNAELDEILTPLGIDASPLITVVTKNNELRALLKEVLQKGAQAEQAQKDIQASQEVLVAERTKLQESLDAPNKAYQEYLVAEKSWSDERSALVGAADITDTLEYYKAQLQELSKIPELNAGLEAKQEQALREIYTELAQIAASREVLFEPVARVVEHFPAIRDDLKVTFQSSLFFNRSAFTEEFFLLVKRNTGGFRGEEEGEERLRTMIRRTDFGSVDSVADLMRGIRVALLSQDTATPVPVQQVLRAGRTSDQLYALLFGLKHIDLRFSLSLAGTTIEQMSPGQRGALLLIFYLLVDNDQSPLILDQPEENLDNQTVYSMLVPIIQQAKERRQIIMVTHNANLAVCCDAEQIIHAEFNRADQFALSYQSGAIEDSELNAVVVDVLEGTTPAFANRRDKYLAE